MCMTAMEIRDLVVKVDGYPIVNGLTLAVEEGERIGIVGDYRDTLFVMDTLCGLVLPDSGEIWIYNMPPRQAFQRGLINYIHQSSPTDSLPIPTILITHNATIQLYNTNVVIQPLPYIEFFNKFIQNNYKIINLIPKRRSESL